MTSQLVADAMITAVECQSQFAGHRVTSPPLRCWPDTGQVVNLTG